MMYVDVKRSFLGKHLFHYFFTAEQKPQWLEVAEIDWCGLETVTEMPGQFSAQTLLCFLVTVNETQH